MIRINFLKTGFLTLVCIGNLSSLSSASDPVKLRAKKLEAYSEVINKDLLFNHLSILASDEMEGRNTGSVGIDKAADYLANEYKKLGLKAVGDQNSYFQVVPFLGTKVQSLTFSLTQKNQPSLSYALPPSLGEANRLFTRLQGGRGEVSGSMIFGGFGATDSIKGVFPFQNLDPAGKWVLIFQDLPKVVNGDTVLSNTVTNQSRLLDLIIRRNAKGVIVVDTESELPFEVYVNAFRKQLETPSNIRFEGRQAPNVLAGGYLRMDPQLAAHLLNVNGVEGLKSMKKEIMFSMKTWKAKELDVNLSMNIVEEQVPVPSKNVVAFLEGSDPVLKNEIVVLSSHYDHVGISNPDASGDYINNGADDDGSGTVGVLAVASAFASAAKDGVRPKRSILFLNVTGEEKGLLGSRYYSDNPLFPVEQHIANINIDMIGRDDPNHIKRGSTNALYIIGANLISSTMDSLLQVANAKTHKMELDRALNDLDDPQQIYRRSDHWNFGRLGIPFVFYFTGIHEDYHRPSDEVEKINFEKMNRISQLVYQNTLEIANTPRKPIVDNQAFIDRTRQTPRN
jgi:hypothetical protein